ncbi:2-oxoglutarate dehydrogenase, E2 component, dihydrolipoamide succinyltransferase [Corynebacterium sp. ACRPH]|uniref:2-oxoglutarate dehydrogenase, E2 component, dihydrolipoamide succinyltransferase n=1 Tax=Corynebacterium sp. ACRPH TaxID=2918199 RepID=UPI001EF299E0|nr:2-oxoglutarate dehydrogenase, E2 component, dihydrolipoamide succinyltransferase [Corynebacterium sp. ACRPH]MCG7456889.1 2-oxoglutarate dehydrogenase, E2 component, dihydrolipoamide succinyltransferase [Corynebacterium sp. ACRPH]
MAYSVEMPELGESVTEGTVTQWLKKVGDKVSVDEPLLEVSTDKVDTEIPSPASGVLLKIIAEEDDTVDVGAVIAEIGEEGEEPSGSGADSSSDDDSSDAAEESAEKSESDSDDSESESSDNSGSESGSDSGSGEAEDVTMPELGESVTEGTITQWLKRVGDKVEVDEPLLEVSTDKVDTEIPSPVAGTLVEILANEDDTVDVGEVIARIGDENAAASGSSDSGSDSSESDESADSSDSSESESDSSESDSSDDSESKSSDNSGSESGSGSGSGEAEDVTMPELGESVTEGTITQWLKSVGDKVEVDEPLLEVSTDKVDTEIPSPVAGTLVEILANEDDTVDVGEVIARIGDENAAKSGSSDSSDSGSSKSDESASEDKAEKSEDKAEPKAEEKKAESKQAEEKAEVKTEAESESKSDSKSSKPAAKQSKPAEGNLPYVTPLVRKLAEKHGVDLSSVEGTGVGGRIRKQDILAAAEDTSASGSSAKSASPAGPRASSYKVDPAKQELRGTVKKVNRIREITAKTTLDSLHAAAQLTQVHEVDMTRIAELRKANKKAFADKHGVNLTYLPFFAKAAVEALISHPNVNASYNAKTKEMTYHEQVNLGIAVDTEAGLLSPVIHDAQDMSLPELAQAIVDIADRARNKKLKPNDLSGGTFTITNIGSEGALTDTPILVPPQAAMIGTGAIVKRPVVLSEDEGEAIAIRQMVFLPMTYDHQVIDGADAGRFMSTLRDRLENSDFTEDLEL